MFGWFSLIENYMQIVVGIGFVAACVALLDRRSQLHSLRTRCRDEAWSGRVDLYRKWKTELPAPANGVWLVALRDVDSICYVCDILFTCDKTLSSLALAFSWRRC